MHVVSDVRLDIPCWLLDIEISQDRNTFTDNARKRSAARLYFCDSVLKGTAGIPALLYSGAAGLSAQA